MRILLITYYFPPCGGAPVQRWLKWLPDLVHNDVEVTVLTTKNGEYPVLDESLLKEIPPSVQVHRVSAPATGKIWNLFGGSKSAIPYGSISKTENTGLMRRILIWLRLNIIIPDLRVFWNPTAYRTAVDILRKNPVDIVITTGPPHSTHLIGMKLKKRFGISWVTDWRDPWTSIYYLRLNPPAKWSMKIQKKMEQSVAQNADLNVVVSEHLASTLPDRNTMVSYNGYDAQKFERLKNEITPPQGIHGFKIKYVGRITEGQRWREMLEIISATLENEDYCLSLIGTQLTTEQSEALEGLMPGKYLVTGFLTNDMALKEMLDSDVLVLLINYYEGSEGMLTTKLFEYLATGNKIIGIGPKGGEAENLIHSYSAGKYFDTGEKQVAGDFLKEIYLAWKAGDLDKNQTDTTALSSQRQIAKLLLKLFELKK
jgi:glycosyltransferase involved in cell wall biosynthesis